VRLAAVTLTMATGMVLAGCASSDPSAPGPGQPTKHATDSTTTPTQTSSPTKTITPTPQTITPTAKTITPTAASPGGKTSSPGGG
jgi:hypothetical protein